MPRYTDADALIGRLKSFRVKSGCLTRDYKRGLSDGVITAVEWIEESASADVSPVKRGEWEFLNDYESRCTACDESSLIDHGDEYKYCPNCGAKMDGEKEGV